MKHLIETADSNEFGVQNDFLVVNGSRDTVSQLRDFLKPFINLYNVIFSPVSIAILNHRGECFPTVYNITIF